MAFLLFILYTCFDVTSAWLGFLKKASKDESQQTPTSVEGGSTGQVNHSIGMDYADELARRVAASIHVTPANTDMNPLELEWRRCSRPQRKTEWDFPRFRNPPQSRSSTFTQTSNENVSQAIQDDVRTTLSNLTRENFDNICQRLARIPLPNHGSKDFLISKIFEKARMDPTLSDMYAELVARVVTHSRQMQSATTFIANHLTARIARTQLSKQITLTIHALSLDLEGDVSSRRAKLLGTVEFALSLYKRRILGSTCLSPLVHDLLRSDSLGVEMASMLLAKVGRTIETDGLRPVTATPVFRYRTSSALYSAYQQVIEMGAYLNIAKMNATFSGLGTDIDPMSARVYKLWRANWHNGSTSVSSVLSSSKGGKRGTKKERHNRTRESSSAPSSVGGDAKARNTRTRGSSHASSSRGGTAK